MRVAEKLTILFSFTGDFQLANTSTSLWSSTRLQMEVGGRDFSEGSQLERGVLLSYGLEQLLFWVFGMWAGGVRNPNSSISRAARSSDSFGYPSEAVGKGCCVLSVLFSLKAAVLLSDWSCHFGVRTCIPEAASCSDCNQKLASSSQSIGMPLPAYPHHSCCSKMPVLSV